MDNNKATAKGPATKKTRKKRTKNSSSSNTSPRNNKKRIRVNESTGAPLVTPSRTPVVSDGEGDEDDDFNEDDKLHRWKESQVQLRDFYDQMSPEQIQRYEQFRRSSFDIGAVNQLIAKVTHLDPKKVERKLSIAVSGSAKIFVGEVIELARIVMEERNDSGPILPHHIRESYRRLEASGKIPFSKKRGSIF